MESPKTPHPSRRTQPYSAPLNQKVLMQAPRTQQMPPASLASPIRTSCLVRIISSRTLQGQVDVRLDQHGKAYLVGHDAGNLRASVFKFTRMHCTTP